MTQASGAPREVAACDLTCRRLSAAGRAGEDGLTQGALTTIAGQAMSPAHRASCLIHPVAYPV